MKKRAFEKFINLSIEKGKKEKLIYDNGLDLINFLDDYSAVNSILLKSIYGDSVSDFISDFIVDSIYGNLEKNKSNYVVYKENGEIIADCSTLDELYKFSEQIRLNLIAENFSYDISEPITDDERFKILSELIKK